MSEVLPYLEVEQGNQEEIEEKEEIKMPDVKGKTVKEAEKILKEVGLEVKLENEEINKDEVIVKSQIPESGINVYKGRCVYID